MRITQKWRNRYKMYTPACTGKNVIFLNVHMFKTRYWKKKLSLYLIREPYINKRGHAVAQLFEALRYKSEDRGLEFFIDIILLAVLWCWG